VVIMRFKILAESVYLLGIKTPIIEIWIMEIQLLSSARPPYQYIWLV